MPRLLLAAAFLALVASPASACWIALDPVMYARQCPIIIRGTIVEIDEAPPPEVPGAARLRERPDDIAHVRVDEIIRNDFRDVPLKVGEKFAVRMVAKSHGWCSTDLNYPVKTEAIWLISLHKEGEFRIDWHPVQKQALADREKLKLNERHVQELLKANDRPDRRPTQADWFAERKAEAERRAKAAAEAEALRKLAREVAEGLAKADKLDAAALRPFREAPSRVRLDVFHPPYWDRPAEKHLEGDRLVEVAEYVLRNEPDEVVRSWAVTRLGRTHREGEPVGKRSIEVLVAALADPADGVREAACCSLRDRGAKDHAKAVAQLLRDPNPSVRRAAIRALGVFGHKESLPAILEVYESEGKKVPWEPWVFVEALARLGETKVMLDIARRALREKDAPSEWIIEGLSQSNSRDVVAVLVESLVPELNRGIVNLSNHARNVAYGKLCKELEKRTGQTLGTDPVAWLDWWEKARADYGASAPAVDRAAAKAAYQQYQRLLDPKK